MDDLPNVISTILLYGIPILVIIIVVFIWNAGRKSNESTAYYRKVVTYDDDGRVNNVTYEERND